MLQEKTHEVETSNVEIQTNKRRHDRSVYQLLINTHDTVQLDIHSDTRTRGHTKKLAVRRCRYDVRKYSFSNRITNIWNSLSDEIGSMSESGPSKVCIARPIPNIRMPMLYVSIANKHIMIND